MIKKSLSLILVFSVLFSFSGCASLLQGFASFLDRPEASTSGTAAEATGDETEWVMYWYLCGSDLETNYGSATEDIQELLAVPLPENVKVVIQTGGADQWQNDFVRADRVQRFLYDHNGLELVDEQPQANMGEAKTLSDFLRFATENYPAKHSLVNLWNHGGATLGGIAYDELYNYDSLDLDELNDALAAVYTPNSLDPAIDIFGFDACLMATLDVADSLRDYAHYMVASEELMPSNGWYYTGMFKPLAANPNLSPLDFSKIICDSYLEGCEIVDTDSDVTLSVANLTKLGDLLVAYENFGKEALGSAIEAPSFFTSFSKIANESENYGGNTREQGYYNMVDLGHLARSSQQLLPQTSAAVLDALDACIEYEVNGRYRSEASGLSCYYSYSGDLMDFSQYTEFGISEAFKHLYYYGLTGNLRPEGVEYVSDLELPGEDFSDFAASDLQEVPSLHTVDWNNAPINISQTNHTLLELGSQAEEILSSVAFQLFFLDVEQDLVVSLGTDNAIAVNWQEGVFEDNFQGTWGSLDGALCYMEVSYESEDYTLYSVPVLLNDVKHNLSIVYDFTQELYVIEGARLPSPEDSTLAERTIVPLQNGDVVQPLHFASTVFGDRGELQEIPADSVTVDENTSFHEMSLGNGTYVTLFEMRDSQGNTALSSPAMFEIHNEEITLSLP